VKGGRAGSKETGVAARTAEATVADLLRRAIDGLGISQDDAWGRYYYRDGDSDGRARRPTFLGWLRGQSEPRASQFFEIASVLNGLYVQRGKRPPFPEWSELTSIVQKNLKRKP
jgi:hypothetical protein